jgi:hypothetical protein
VKHTTEEKFWSIIEAARTKKSSEARLKAIYKELLPLNGRALSEFKAVALAWTAALDRNDLRAAAATILGTAGDESFLGFRTWLLLQGRAAVDAAVADPDVIVDWKNTATPRAEGLVSLAKKALGHEVEDLPFTVDTSGWPADRLPEPTSTDEDRARLFPRLSADPLHKRVAKVPRTKKPTRWIHAGKSAVGEPLPYSRDRRYRVRQRVLHPTYGECIVEAISADRMTVLFADDRSRVLLHAVATPSP